MLLLLIIVVMFTIYLFKETHYVSKLCYGGAIIDKDTALYRSYLIFMKLQEINTDIFQVKSIKDFWIANYFFTLSNKLFTSGKSNTLPDFPLISDSKLVGDTLEDIKIFTGEDAEERISTATTDILNIYKKTYPTDNILKTVEKQMVISDDSFEQYKKRYPTISDDNIYALFLRYGAISTYLDNVPNGRTMVISSTFLSIPPVLYEFYNNNLPNCIECFASPINHTLDKFCSIYHDDMVFGSIGPFTEKVVSENKGSSFIINPPYDPATMDYVYRIIATIEDSNYTVCLPSKDGGLFHRYEGRIEHRSDDPFTKPNDSLVKLLNLSALSRILIIPSRVMHYWRYFEQRKQRVSMYDTIMLFYLKDVNINKFVSDVKKILIYFAYGDSYGHQKLVYDINEEKIKEIFPENALKIIDSLKIKF